MILIQLDGLGTLLLMVQHFAYTSLHRNIYTVLVYNDYYIEVLNIRALKTFVGHYALFSVGLHQQENFRN